MGALQLVVGRLFLDLADLVGGLLRRLGLAVGDLLGELDRIGGECGLLVEDRRDRRLVRGDDLLFGRRRRVGGDLAELAAPLDRGELGLLDLVDALALRLEARDRRLGLLLLVACCCSAAVSRLISATWLPVVSPVTWPPLFARLAAIARFSWVRISFSSAWLRAWIRSISPWSPRSLACSVSSRAAPPCLQLVVERLELLFELGGDRRGPGPAPA